MSKPVSLAPFAFVRDYVSQLEKGANRYRQDQRRQINKRALREQHVVQG